VSRPRSGARILLVEDDPDHAAVALRAFRRHHLETVVQVVENGARALAYLRSAALGERAVPEVVLLDLRMPEIDGLDVVRAVRAAEGTRHLPVVMISSSDRRMDIEASYRAGANSFVVKRFEPGKPGEYLVDVARYWLGLNEGWR
jgi:CheY-like chemotaxis protein